MKTAQLGQYLIFEGKLVKVVSINPGSKSINMETIEDHLCPHCGESLGKKQIEVIESSPMFQNGAESIRTIDE